MRAPCSICSDSVDAVIGKFEGRYEGGQSLLPKIAVRGIGRGASPECKQGEGYAEKSYFHEGIQSGFQVRAAGTDRLCINPTQAVRCLGELLTNLNQSPQSRPSSSLDSFLLCKPCRNAGFPEIL